MKVPTHNRSINTIRQLAATVYGEDGYSLTTSNKRVFHRDGKTSLTGKVLYSLDMGNHWHTGKSLCELLEKVIAYQNGATLDS